MMEDFARAPRRRIFAILAILCVFTATDAVAQGRWKPAPEPGPVDRDLRAEGYALLREGDRAGALASLRAAAKTAKDGRLWQLVGDLHFDQNEPKEALQAWNHALAAYPEDTALLERVARAAALRGDFARAAHAEGRRVEILRARVARNPASAALARAYRRHLMLYSELSVLAGDFTSAEQAAHTLMRFEPKGTAGRLALAYVHLQAAEYDEAEDLYDDVLAMDPANSVALNNLGNIYYMRRDLSGAQEHFERILALEHLSRYSESIAFANLAELYQLRGGYEDAEYLYGQAIQAMPEGAWSYMGQAALFDLLGEHDRAVDTMIDGWERDRNRLTRLNMHFYQPEWYWHRDALIAQIEGEVDEARRLWTRVLRGEVDGLRAVARHHLKSIGRDD